MCYFIIYYILLYLTHRKRLPQQIVKMKEKYMKHINQVVKMDNYTVESKLI